MSTRSVLVTGASGFLGRWAVPELITLGYSVHATIRGPVPAELNGATLHACDLLDSRERTALVEKIRPGYLLHFAWNADPGVYWITLDNYAWVTASLDLVRAFHAAGGVRAVMAGSCAEYDWGQGGVFREDGSPTVLCAAKPALPYAVCKASLQQMLAAYCRQERLSIAWGRIFFQYGPDEHPQRLVSSVIRSLLRGEEAVCTHGNQRRSFLYSADVGAAFAALLDHGAEGVVNIGSREDTTVARVVETIAQLTGRSDLVRLGARQAPPDEPAILLPDTRRLFQEIGFHPRETLASGLDKTVAWWRDRLTAS